jgi:hypothetical protein
VTQPVDGLFTGVIGVDSTFQTEFETTYDFSEPGEYIIDVFTQLQQDTNYVNDTLRFSLTTSPFVDQFPYLEGFEEYNGGWLVGEGSNNASWQHGQPAGALISSAADGLNAWVTNLTGGYNDAELSYLLSPCMDFTSFNEDPRISFSLFVQTEACCDELWLESSIDGGETWTKVGAAGTGLNWYNDTFSQWWDGTGGFDGWVTATNILQGTAGQPEVRLRFVFSTDFSVVAEGIGVDNVLISEQQEADLAAVSTVNSAIDCGLPDDAVTVRLINLGTEPQSNFTVSYQVNGGAIVSEVAPGPIDPGAQLSYTFTQTFDSSLPGSYTVTAWSDLSADGLLLNDTVSYVFISAFGLPYYQDFELGVIPADWTFDADIFATPGHGNTSFVAADNLYSGDQTFNMTTPAFGPVEVGDVLYFDYRYTLWSAGIDPYELSGTDRLEVSVSTDCGETYTTVATINADNHVPTAELTGVEVSLDDYAGQSVRVRFRAFWGSTTGGDYWFDLDNIFLQRCAGLQLSADVTGATPGSANGSATVNAGVPTGPYTYAWSNGSSNRTATGLTAGVYSVTVTDNFGCQDVLTVVVDVMVGVNDNAAQPLGRIALSPNPSNGQSWLQLELRETADVQIQVFNTLGQPVWQSANLPGVTRHRQELDLVGAPAGMYLVRVLSADGRSQTVRWLKTE